MREKGEEGVRDSAFTIERFSMGALIEVMRGELNGDIIGLCAVDEDGVVGGVLLGVVEEEVEAVRVMVLVEGS